MHLASGPAVRTASWCSSRCRARCHAFKIAMHSSGLDFMDVHAEAPAAQRLRGEGFAPSEPPRPALVSNRTPHYGCVFRVAWWLQAWTRMQRRRWRAACAARPSATSLRLRATSLLPWRCRTGARSRAWVCLAAWYWSCISNNLALVCLPVWRCCKRCFFMGMCMCLADTRPAWHAACVTRRPKSWTNTCAVAP